jgi:hypothetical protein
MQLGRFADLAEARQQYRPPSFFHSQSLLWPVRRI